jgi:hypothetical protein
MALAGAEVFATRSAAIQSSEGNNDGRIAQLVRASFFDLRKGDATGFKFPPDR